MINAKLYTNTKKSFWIENSAFNPIIKFITIKGVKLLITCESRVNNLLKNISDPVTGKWIIANVSSL